MTQSQLPGTERISEAHRDLDTLPTADIVTALLEDQARGAQAALEAAAALTRAAEEIAARLARGGRLLYAGAGTSGRLAQLDAAELPPTFSWPTERAVALLAGGREAMWEAREGAEDDAEQGAADLLALDPGPNDALLAIAASGTTPYALGALHAAKQVGTLAVGIANNPGTPLLAGADIAILLNTGPEVISGSTRLKAGTAQKIALNTLSSSVMVRLGKVYGNLMVDLKATNAKLRARAVRLVQAATGHGESESAAALEACGWQVSAATVMLLRGVSAEEARARLEASGGHVRAALE
ncbi:N-acetylmuramic acid 6-phosphate etherase [Deinobacterium chartae]|uniref:N-acetylmuramic acid 6-phosphate etherase n=1 Tax=Deinobacterium chartae TaxID=521158 RepID=A0A841I459_9DEIO|nr:N-acetylmuramic acid 6-phosphate etherase [Deinobacterium chartae]MBB6099824.1 N-acetylmuramic acid 6-phosphate etherase [Deinobacterium chartae]